MKYCACRPSRNGLHSQIRCSAPVLQMRRSLDAQGAADVGTGGCYLLRCKTEMRKHGHLRVCGQCGAQARDFFHAFFTQDFGCKRGFKLEGTRQCGFNARDCPVVKTLFRQALRVDAGGVCKGCMALHMRDNGAISFSA